MLLLAIGLVLGGFLLLLVLILLAIALGGGR
jgi:hypothetical protein